MAKEQPKNLQEYLLSTGVDITKRRPGVLESDEVLAKVSTAWSNNEEGIRAVIEERMQAIRDDLILSCLPVEVLELRRSLLELGQLLDDFVKYHAEAERRSEEHGKQKEEAEEEAVAETSPLAEEVPEEDNSSM
jgi:hypothetical protein